MVWTLITSNGVHVVFGKKKMKQNQTDSIEAVNSLHRVHVIFIKAQTDIVGC